MLWEVCRFCEACFTGHNYTENSISAAEKTFFSKYMKKTYWIVIRPARPLASQNALSSPLYQRCDRCLSSYYDMCLSEYQMYFSYRHPAWRQCKPFRFHTTLSLNIIRAKRVSNWYIPIYVPGWGTYYVPHTYNLVSARMYLVCAGSQDTYM